MNRISRLLYRRFAGTLTESEEAELKEWASHHAVRREMLGRLFDPEHLGREHALRGLIDSARAEGEMRARIRKTRRPVLMRRAAIAASFTLILAAASWLWLNRSDAGQPRAEALAEAAPIRPGGIAPGETGAQLRLGNGETISLGRSDDSRSTESIMSEHGVSAPKANRSLSLEVPAGQEFKIVLEDSTEVWLNSASTLSYPEHFLAGARNVSVTGEAYFKVKPDASRPFTVQAGNQTIRVVGTSFNVRCYPEDGCVTTTLEAGCVALSGGSGTGEVLLSPGHQSNYSESSATVSIREVDTETFTGWRTGRFVFEDQTLGVIMRDLARWYNFSYDFADPELEQVEFMGSVPRYADFATAVQILENSGGILFEITGEHVSVRKMKNEK